MTGRVAALVERAKAAADFDDFGGDGWREGLEVLLAAADREARLTAQGAAIFEAQLAGFLTWRLKVERTYAEHPEIDAQEIVAPLIGLGLPRTGSSALAMMLGADPAARSIRNWEAQASVPPPETATEHDDPRIAAAEAMLAARHARFPRMKQMVPSTATAPTECQTFMAYDMKSLLFATIAWVPSYAHWLLHEADPVPTYRYLKRVLKLLQWRCPPTRWRLKNPAHMLSIDALDAVFPDARFVMTHRGIEHVIPSVADLYHELIGTVSEGVPLATLAEFNADLWETGLRRLIAFRAAGNEDRFFDIAFDAFQHDPMACIAVLYRWLGEPLTVQARAAMEEWRRDSPRDKHGRHVYDAADFAIDPAALRARFAFYAERFDIAPA